MRPFYILAESKEDAYKRMQCIPYGKYVGELGAVIPIPGIAEKMAKKPTVLGNANLLIRFINWLKK